MIVPRHAREQMRKRGIGEAEVSEALKSGSVVFEEVNGRFGTKKYTAMGFGDRDLVVVWFRNKTDEEEVVTVYWRRKR
ncbi:MAG: DUF4258 domain-containing protein [Candidatus Micrarchaeota archaeon]